MKIALLNLPVDNNYGGNLQRYALMKVLQDLGHDVTHIYIKGKSILPWYKIPYSYPKRIFRKYILRKKDERILFEKHMNLEKEKRLLQTLEFYDKYIKHTSVCYNIKDVIRICRNQYDAYIVGSDQVWRKSSTGQIGLENYFLKFVKEDVKRFAYAVSFGVEGTSLSKKERERINELYKKFDAVSVREASALKIVNRNKWTKPEAKLCLDPTFLLAVSDYNHIIDENDVVDVTKDKIFAYILDKTDRTNFIVNCYKHRLNKDVIEVGLNDTPYVSIAQWLNNIRNAEFIITDSFHGVVFSIIFRRPFIFLGNKDRGNARILSIFEILHLGSPDDEVKNYTNIDRYLCTLQESSLSFLKGIRK